MLDRLSPHAEGTASPSAAATADSTFPFSAVVGADDMALALVLTAISPQIGGVLVRGEKGTAKSTMVRGLAAVLPPQEIVAGCRFACEPAAVDPTCPDGPHGSEPATQTRPARLVELPVGATEDRVVGSLDLGQALGQGVAAFEPGLLSAAHRGILYVDEVNLLHDHLVDLLLDAAAMGRNTVERDGISISHAARLVLIGTMNPEEGELRPQLLDRFGLTVEVAAPRDPALRAEVVRRRLSFDADPGAFAQRFAAEQDALRDRIAAARKRVAHLALHDSALATIARVCAAFEVDGMRADLVTARAAVAHAAWGGRDRVTKADIRAAARLALPHRRRRNPFDAPGIDEDVLDQILDEQGPDPEPDPVPDPERPRATEPPESADPPEATESPDATEPPEPRSGSTPRPEDTDSQEEPSALDDHVEQDGPQRPSAAMLGAALPSQPFRTRLLAARGTGHGEAGHRSRAITTTGKSIGATPRGTGPLHLPATIRAAARRQRDGHRRNLQIHGPDLRHGINQGRESNLVLFCVDASGSMAARKRMEAVKTAVLSLLLDAYQRRDKVALVTFLGEQAELMLPPTSSVDVAARRLAELPHGGRTPLAEGLLRAYETLRLERIRDPQRRPLLVVVTDGRATSGRDATSRATTVARHLHTEGVSSVVIDCESGRFRLGMARRLAVDLGAEHVPLEEIAAGAIVEAVHRHLDPEHDARSHQVEVA